MNVASAVARLGRLGRGMTPEVTALRSDVHLWILGTVRKAARPSSASAVRDDNDEYNHRVQVQR